MTLLPIHHDTRSRHTQNARPRAHFAPARIRAVTHTHALDSLSHTTRPSLSLHASPTPLCRHKHKNTIDSEIHVCCLSLHAFYPRLCTHSHTLTHRGCAFPYKPPTAVLACILCPLVHIQSHNSLTNSKRPSLHVCNARFCTLNLAQASA